MGYVEKIIGRADGSINSGYWIRCSNTGRLVCREFCTGICFGYGSWNGSCME